MKKQRLFKMTEIEQNMLAKALWDIRRSDPDRIGGFVHKVQNVPKRRLYLSDTEFRLSLAALNCLRRAYLSAGRYSDGIDAVILKLMQTKYRRAPVR